MLQTASPLHAFRQAGAAAGEAQDVARSDRREVHDAGPGETLRRRAPEYDVHNCRGQRAAVLVSQVKFLEGKLIAYRRDALVVDFRLLAEINCFERGPRPRHIIV